MCVYGRPLREALAKILVKPMSGAILFIDAECVGVLHAIFCAFLPWCSPCMDHGDDWLRIVNGLLVEPRGAYCLVYSLRARASHMMHVAGGTSCMAEGGDEELIV
ncbi:hypothetical protein TcCL_Unassigned04938 [Trypanosoma cruzi]|nr:hypothetical protein TcCL_Unassigned04938 [Trypanosoma cruzi]